MDLGDPSPQHLQSIGTWGWDYGLWGWPVVVSAWTCVCRTAEGDARLGNGAGCDWLGLNQALAPSMGARHR